MIKLGRPSHNLTPEEKQERKIRQARESKQRRKELITKLQDAGQAMCKEPLCIFPAEHSGLCPKHSGHADRRPEKKTCVKCGAIPMTGSTLCGYCDELLQEQRQESRRRNKAERIAKIREGRHATQNA